MLFSVVVAHVAPIVFVSCFLFGVVVIAYETFTLDIGHVYIYHDRCSRHISCVVYLSTFTQSKKTHVKEKGKKKQPKKKRCKKNRRKKKFVVDNDSASRGIQETKKNWYDDISMHAAQRKRTKKKKHNKFKIYARSHILSVIQHARISTSISELIADVEKWTREFNVHIYRRCLSG